MMFLTKQKILNPNLIYAISSIVFLGTIFFEVSAMATLLVFLFSFCAKTALEIMHAKNNIRIRYSFMGLFNLPLRSSGQGFCSVPAMKNIQQ